ncbi:MAG TPA: TIGR03435 family protein [Bryobacteraceae bacterium]|nr:TIGR03435 family protein [Bryobacteraceae bacterium]
MLRALFGSLLLSSATLALFGQSTDGPPKFAAADVHISPKTRNSFVRTVPVRNGRYEVKQATMVDLIHLAYEIDADKVLGGPNWLEMNRYDVIAKVPEGSPADALKPMLQTLLGERFKLALHKEMKPLPTYALVAGKKPQLKQAEGTEESGCRPQSAVGGQAAMTVMIGGGDGPTRLVFGPGGTVQYACRNITMGAFVAGLPRMIGGGALGPNPILDETGLKGGWNFDLRWSAMFGFGPAENQAERITIFEAVEKQLGLKLEARQVPIPVMVVDSVNEKPTENPPGTSDILPVVPAPTEFEVASVKPAKPGGRGISFRPANGGRLTASGAPMRLLLLQAFNANNDSLVGVPSWADTERFDITAKAPGDAAATDREALAPMLRSLLVERFGLQYHTEDRQIAAYSLTGNKPKMKRADPASRTFCKDKPPPPGAPPFTRVLTCQNATMAQFAEYLQYMTQELNWPVADATEIEGTWDFTLTFSMNFGMPMMRGGGEAAAGAGPAAPPDPSGGLSIFEAVEKELGLKLEKQKRTEKVIVIDHLEQKPTEN